MPDVALSRVNRAGWLEPIGTMERMGYGPLRIVTRIYRGGWVYEYAPCHVPPRAIAPRIVVGGGR